MSFVAVGLYEIIVVKCFYYGVFMALSQLAFLVGFINSRRTQSLYVHAGIYHFGRNDGLAAAVYASARASHNLDELVVGFAGLDVFQHLSGVCKSVRYAHFDFSAVHVEGCALYTLSASDRLKVKRRRLVAGNNLVHGT